MKKAICLSAFFFLVLFCSFSPEAAAQRVNRDRKQNDNFSSRLWYGGGLNLGFASNNFESLFQIGVSPMVGYKIFEEFSVGPRAAIQYSYYKVRFGNSTESAQPLSWALGVFSRYKIIRNIFLHAEYELENEAVFNTFSGDLEVLRRERNNVFIGGGYNSGAPFGYEILLLYNLNLPENNSLDLPFELRFGFTYNF